MAFADNHYSLLYVWFVLFFCVFGVMCMGFLMVLASRSQFDAICVRCVFFVLLMLCARMFLGCADKPTLVAMCVYVAWFSCVFDAVCMGFLIGFAGKPRSAAICVAFVSLLGNFEAMCMGF